MTNTQCHTIYNTNPQANPPVQFSESAQAAESQVQSCSQRFGSRNVKIAIASGMAVATAVVVGLSVWASSSDDEQQEGLAGRLIDTVTTTGEMLTVAVSEAAKQTISLLDRYQIPCKVFTGRPFCYSTNPCDFYPPCPPGEACSSNPATHSDTGREFEPPYCD